MPELEHAKPHHEQIHDYYAAEIRDGRLTTGMPLPSIRDIARDWDTSPATAARGLAWLATDGLVTASRKGTFVKAGRLRPGPQARLAFTAPEAGTVRVLAADLETRAPRYIWPLLGLEPVRMDGECHVVRREQLHHGPGGEPYMLMVDWVHPRLLAPNTDPLLTREPLPAPGGAAALIEARSGIPAVRGRLGFEARRPRDDGREVPLLRLRRGGRVLAVVWTWFSAAEAMVYTEAVLPEDTVLEAEWTR